MWIPRGIPSLIWGYDPEIGKVFNRYLVSQAFVLSRAVSWLTVFIPYKGVTDLIPAGFGNILSWKLIIKNIFCGHSPPSADSRRAFVSSRRVLVNCLED